MKKTLCERKSYLKNSIKTQVWREAIQLPPDVLQNRSTWWQHSILTSDTWTDPRQREFYASSEKRPRGSLKPVMICRPMTVKMVNSSGAFNPRWVSIFGITSLRGRPICSSDLDLDCLAANGWQTTVIIGVIASCKGFPFCVGLKSCQHNSITYLHFKWSAHLHFPFTSPSKTNYFLFIMEGLGMVVVTFFCPKVYLRGYRSIRRKDTYTVYNYLSGATERQSLAFKVVPSVSYGEQRWRYIPILWNCHRL